MAVEKVRPIDRYLEIFYSLGAVPVLLGVLFKLTGTSPFGDPNIWLQIGLYTEVLVFLSFGLMYLFNPPQKVDEMGNPAGAEDALVVKKAMAKDSALVSVDEMLKAADITPENLGRLSAGFKSLEANITRISHASESLVDTEEYSRQIKQASATIGQMNTYYKKLAETSDALVNSAEDAKNTQKEIADLSKNLARLNQMYSGMIAAMQMKNG
ncbi:GldL-related protein [Niabella hirudinis]|uniref:GldL-related protein n=1 Tax=Niabella hirudinis TaxID=1285929 RepID=UPI003EBEE3E3